MRTADIGNDQTELNRLLRSRYTDGDYGCNAPECLRPDARRFVPVLAEFVGASCTPAPLSPTARLAALASNFSAPQSAGGPCPHQCFWVASPQGQDPFTRLSAVGVLEEEARWQRCRQHSLQKGLRLRQPNRGTYWMWGGRVQVGVLPMERFLQGHTYFIQRLHALRAVEPIHVHVTYTMGSDYGKLWRLKTAGLWVERKRTSSEGEYLQVSHQLHNVWCTVSQPPALDPY